MRTRGRIRRFAAFAVAAVIIATGTVPEYAHAEDGDTYALTAESDEVLQYGHYKYTVNDDGKTVTITGYIDRDVQSITVPGKIKGKKVTAIDYSVFYGYSRLTSVDIPDSVTSIDSFAFSDCTGLKSIVIPDSVTSINPWAFDWCENLKKVNIPSSVETIGRRAFMGCSSLTDIEIPYGVCYIYGSAFNSCTGLTAIEIPASVSYIEQWAFENCGSLTSISVDPANTHYDSRDNCNALIETDTNRLLWGCANTIIPDTVTEINERAFMNCSGLTSIVIPDGVTRIRVETFQGCSSLESVEIPNSVTWIYASAFEGCDKLTIRCSKNSEAHKYAVNNGIKYSFAGMPDIIVDISSAAVTGIKNAGYTGKPIIQTGLTVKSDKGVLKSGTDYTVTYKNNINIGKAKVVITGKGSYTGNITKTFNITVKNNAVYKVGSLKYRVTNAAVGGKGTVALVGASVGKTDKKFTSLSIPATVKLGGVSFRVTSVGANSFKGYTNLKKVTVGSNVTTIGANAFSGCTKLTSVSLGGKVTTIGSKAFYGDKSLKTISVSSTKLKTVGRSAFAKISAKPVVKAPKAKLGSYRKLMKKGGMTAKAIYKKN